MDLHKEGNAVLKPRVAFIFLFVFLVVGGLVAVTKSHMGSDGDTDIAVLMVLCGLVAFLSGSDEWKGTPKERGLRAANRMLIGKRYSDMSALGGRRRKGTLDVNEIVSDGTKGGPACRASRPGWGLQAGPLIRRDGPRR